MKKDQEFRKSWKASKNQGKQRKYIYNAPMHIRKKFMSANLSKDLRKETGKRNIPVKTGDTVKILRGQFKGTINTVERVSLVKRKIFVKGAETTKKSGARAQYPITPSNVQIIKLNKEGKRRLKARASKEEKSKKETKNQLKEDKKEDKNG